MPDPGSTSLYWPDWGALIVAVIALVQPWLIAAWRKYLRRGSIAIHETRNIEVGFSTFGPTIGLVGTLRGLYQDVFLKRATVTAVRKRDNARMQLPWRAFRSNSLVFGETEPRTLEVASSFLLTPAEPFKYNIFFASDNFTTEYRPLSGTVMERWDGFVREKLKELDPKWESQIAKALEDPLASNALFDGFMKTSEPSDLYRKLSNEFFWHAGEYVLHMQFESSRPDRSFTKSWQFSLQEKDVSQLRLNAIAILRELCGLPYFYHFAYPEYEHGPYRHETVT